MSRSHRDAVKEAVLEYVNRADGRVPTYRLHLHVGNRFGLDMRHGEVYGAPPAVRRMEGQISRAAAQLAAEGKIVRTVERTGRGQSRSAYYRSLAVAERERAEAARQQAEAGHAEAERVQLEEAFRAAGYETMVTRTGVIFLRDDAQRLLTAIGQR